MFKLCLNHIYAVIGEVAYHSLKRSSFFMKKFANIEEKTNSAVGFGQWHGLYIRGQNTYIELFETLDNHKVGDFGFGFGVQTENELMLLHDFLKPKYQAIELGDFRQPDQPLPLFKYLRLQAISDPTTGKKISPFILTYTADTFKIRKSKGAFAPEDVSRKRYNSLAWNVNRYFRDVTDIAITTTPQLSASCAAIFEDIGLIGRKDSSDRTMIIYAGEDFKLTMKHPFLSSSNMCSFGMQLINPVAMKETHEFAGGNLVVDKDRADLTFL